MGRIDKVLLREIDLKATAVRNDPNYYLKRAHKIQHALSNSAKIYSWWIEHPELRRIIIGKIDTQKKAHLIGIMKTSELHDCFKTKFSMILICRQQLLRYEKEASILIYLNKLYLGGKIKT